MDQPTNDFECSVGAVLKENGYQVVAQVGVAGFFIDLGVKHPTRAGTFLLGIECDGASYHSGRSARDRDRLRQEILENLGWKIHRVWSTDWFRSRDSRISAGYSVASKIFWLRSHYQWKIVRISRTEAIAPASDCAAGRRNCASLPGFAAGEKSVDAGSLEEFIAKRPKTKDEWFRRIPQPLRPVLIRSR